MKWKRFLLSLFFIFGFITLSFSQDWGFGLKGSINQSFTGDIQGNPAEGSTNWAGLSEGSGTMGFGAGAYLQRNFGRFFVRGEVLYTLLESEFDIPESTSPSVYSVDKLEIPVLFGYNVTSPLDIYFGPAYSNILNSTLRGATSPQVITVQDVPLTAQAGIQVQFGRLGLDLRYVHSLATKESQPLQFSSSIYDPNNNEQGADRATFLDARVNYVSLGVFFELGGPRSTSHTPGRNRRNFCYW